MRDQEKYNIQAELESLAPNLSKLAKSTRFKVPEGYFDQVEDQITSQLSLIPYTEVNKNIPANYFQSVEENILQSVLVPRQPKVVPFYKKNSFRAIAAAAILIISAFTVFKFVSSGNTSEEVVAEADMDEAIYYYLLDQDIDDVDLTQLIEYDLIEESDLAVITYDDSELSNEPEYEAFFDSEIPL